MADSRPSTPPVMDLRVIALYPIRIPALSGRPGVRFRSRPKRECTVVPCRVTPVDGRSVATPEYTVPEGTPPPRYKAQCEVVRASLGERRVVHVVLSAEPDALKMDPEQILLSPIFDDGHRLIFEFQRAHILSVNRRGELESRLVAVHPLMGVVGTKTVHRFHTRLSPLAARCVEHLAGALDLYPARERPERNCKLQIPAGEANLTFDSDTKPSHRRDIDPEHAEPKTEHEPGTWELRTGNDTVL